MMQHWVQKGVASARHSEGVLTLALGGHVVLSMGRRTALEVIDAMLEALKPEGTAAEPVATNEGISPVSSAPSSVGASVGLPTRNAR